MTDSPLEQLQQELTTLRKELAAYRLLGSAERDDRRNTFLAETESLLDAYATETRGVTYNGYFKHRDPKEIRKELDEHIGQMAAENEVAHMVRDQSIAQLIEVQHELALLLDKKRSRALRKRAHNGAAKDWCCEAASNSNGWLHDTKCRHFGKAT